MRNPFLHVFLYCENLEEPYQRWPPDVIFNKIFLTHCTSLKIIKYVFKGVFWYAGTILNVVSNNQIQDAHQTPALKNVI